MCHRSALLSPRPTTNYTRPVGGSIGYDGSGKRKEREMRGGLQWPVCADRLPFVFTVLCASFHRLHTLSPVTPLQALCFPFFQFLCSVSVYRCLFALSAVLQSVMCVCVCVCAWPARINFDFSICAILFPYLSLLPSPSFPSLKCRTCNSMVFSRNALFAPVLLLLLSLANRITVKSVA